MIVLSGADLWTSNIMASLPGEDEGGKYTDFAPPVHVDRLPTSPCNRPRCAQELVCCILWKLGR